MNTDKAIKLSILCADSVKHYYDGFKPSDDSGFDIYVPEDIRVPGNKTVKINHKIKCEPVNKHGYYLYPRSSISKTPLMCHNNVGIIDSGYRGDIIGAVYNLSAEDYVIKAGTRLFQMCMPNLEPFNVQFVSSLSQTERGEGGFGSTGN